MKKALKWLRLVFLCLPRVVWEYFTYMRKYSKHPEDYPIEERYRRVRGTILFLLRQMKMELDLDPGTAPILGRGKLIIANHLSMFDPLILIALSPEPIGIVAKKETLKMPFVPHLIKAIDGIFIDRDDPMGTLRKFRDVAKLIKAEKIGYAVFPEGTRNKFPYGMMNEFHPGSFKLASMAGLDIQPVLLFGEQRFVEEKAFHRSYYVQASALPVVPLAEMGPTGTGEFAERMEKEMDAPLQRLIEKDRRYYENGQGKKKAKKWWKMQQHQEWIHYENEKNAE